MGKTAGLSPSAEPCLGDILPVLRVKAADNLVGEGAGQFLQNQEQSGEVFTPDVFPTLLLSSLQKGC